MNDTVQYIGHRSRCERDVTVKSCGNLDVASFIVVVRFVGNGDIRKSRPWVKSAHMSLCALTGSSLPLSRGVPCSHTARGSGPGRVDFSVYCRDGRQETCCKVALLSQRENMHGQRAKKKCVKALQFRHADIALPDDWLKLERVAV